MVCQACFIFLLQSNFLLIYASNALSEKLHGDLTVEYKKSGRTSISTGSTAFCLSSPQKISIRYIRTVL